MKKEASFTEGPILSPLLCFTVPVLAALFLQAMYGAVDLLVVGQFGSPADVSAVSTGSQIMHTVTGLVTNLSMGATILLGQKLGQKRRDEAGYVVGSAVTLFAIIAIMLTAVMLIAARPISSVMRAPVEAFEQTVTYVLICSSGAVLIVAYNVLGAVFRGIGDSKTPLMAVAIACAVNIAGDLLLIGVFQMGVAGAAIATVAAQGVSVLISLLVTAKRGLPFSFSLSYLLPQVRYVGQIMKLGTPVALQSALVSVSFMAITAIVNSLGVIASAGVGVAEKLCEFIMLVPSAFMQSLSAFVAQNIGARQPGRAKGSMLYGMGASMAFGVVLAYLSFFHGSLLCGIFTQDIQVVAAGSEYLKAYAVDTLLTSIMFCFAGYFNGCGKTTFVMVQGFVGAFLVRIPVSFLMSRLEPVSLFQVGLATPCSTAVQILLFAGYFLVLAKSEKHSTILTERESH